MMGLFMVFSRTACPAQEKRMAQMTIHKNEIRSIVNGFTLLSIIELQPVVNAGTRPKQQAVRLINFLSVDAAGTR
jgi:hypothetical protein